MSNLVYPILKSALHQVYADLVRMEDVLREGDLNWTVVRPVRLTDRPPTRIYRMAFGQNVRDGLFISHADVAHRILCVLDEPGTFRQTVGIANQKSRSSRQSP